MLAIFHALLALESELNESADMLSLPYQFCVMLLLAILFVPALLDAARK